MLQHQWFRWPADVQPANCAGVRSKAFLRKSVVVLITQVWSSSYHLQAGSEWLAIPARWVSSSYTASALQRSYNKVFVVDCNKQTHRPAEPVFPPLQTRCSSTPQINFADLTEGPRCQNAGYEEMSDIILLTALCKSWACVRDNPLSGRGVA